MPFFTRSALPSIRNKTAMLVLACALPTMLGFIVLGYNTYQRERTGVLHDGERAGEALILAVERDLQNGETAARALASSPSLAAGDLAAFHAQARSIQRPEFPAYAFTLSDLDGRPLLNTRVPYGAALPAAANTEAIRRVARTGNAVTSNLWRNEGTQRWLLSVDVPVRVDGEMRYVLSVQFRPERMVALIADQRLPAGWSAQVFDAEQTIVARDLSPERFIGVKARPAIAAMMRAGQVGAVELVSREGLPIYSIFARSGGVRGWYSAVNVPANAPWETLSSSMGEVLAIVAALLGVGLFAAWTIGGRIGASVRALTRPAAALGRAEPMTIPPLHIREAAEVAEAMREVEQQLAGYRHDLEALVAERTAELQRANAQLATVYATAPVGLCFLDRELRVVMINDYLAAINAMSVADHLGRSLPELLGDAGVELEKTYRQVLDSGKPIVDMETSTVTAAHPDQVRHFVVSYYPVFQDGEAVGINGMIIDITERKLQEQRLRDHDEQFRVLYELSSDAHMLVARQAGFIGGNAAAARMFGCASIEEFLTLSPATTSPEFQADGERSDVKAQRYMQIALDQGSHHFEWLHQRADGSLFHADVLLTSLNIGGTGVMQATVRDISARIAAEAALRASGEQLAQSERFIRTIADNVPGYVAYWDAGLRCRFANRAFCRFLRQDPEHIVGKHVEEALHKSLLNEVWPYLQGVLDGQPQDFEREYRMPSGEVAWLWSNYIPDFDDQGAVRGFYVLVSDVSERKRAELRLQYLNEQLLEALDRAEMASSAKSEFLANMSHEIRTPMNAIMGLARLLEEAPLERRERGYVSRMKTATRSLLGILNDVLDFSKIEAGQLKLEHTPFPLDQVLSGITVLLANNAWQKDVEPVFDIGEDVALQMVGDPMRLEQVLLNLIGNAIKFTARGEVVLAVRSLGAPGAAPLLEFTVRDTGIGIAPSQQASMFDAFSQGDSSTSRKYGGTGLGLAICRRLVTLMGGDIRVDSALGEGATFRFTLQFGQAPVALPAPRETGLRALVVDDNASAREAVAARCRAHGLEVDCVASGAAALEALRGSGHYDLMFLDSAMSELDGISVLTYARSDPAIRVPPCAMMVADLARERLASLAEDLRLDAILSKPVTPAAFAAALAELRGEQGGLQASTVRALAGSLAGIRVLLVEDNQINQEVASYILRHAGADADIASNGRIAVSMLGEAPTRYDAVLMDIQMPVMNGYEAASAIRAMGLSTLPIIAMTANALEDDRQRALAAGMQAHVAKPIDVDELVATLRQFTGGAALPVEAAPREGDAELPADIAGIDLRTALPRFGGHVGRFIGLLKRFARSQDATLDEVRQLLREERRQDAQAIVHRLRGVAANLGANDIASSALAFEQALRGADDSAVLLQLADLDAAMRVVLEAARELREPEESPVTGAQATPADLERLLFLLKEHNLKAIALFDSLRGELAARLPAAELAELADAVQTLGFTRASALIEAIVKRKEDA